MSNGARINERDKYGLTPLHYAAMRGNELAARELLLCRDEIDVEVIQGMQKKGSEGHIPRRKLTFISRARMTSC